MCDINGSPQINIILRLDMFQIININTHTHPPDFAVIHVRFLKGLSFKFLFLIDFRERGREGWEEGGGEREKHRFVVLLTDAFIA